MEKYVSHYSAAYAWDIPYLDSVFGADGRRRQPDGGMEDITVFGERKKHTERGRLVHVRKTPLPAGATVRRRGRLVASPPLVFLELAGRLDFHRLVLLGLQMCSHQPGRPDEAITSKEQLRTFVTMMDSQKKQRLRGGRKALAALNYIEDGSHSIMESCAFMILTLPHRRGGFGLDGARFNCEIPLDSEAQRRLRQKRCFVDLYYRKSGLAVEYDSLRHHATPKEQGQDALRASALERLGVNVVRLPTIQLYDKEACEEFARNLAAKLGKRIRIRTSKFEAAHLALRALLPTKSETET
jgi:hypothetical protein